MMEKLFLNFNKKYGKDLPFETQEAVYKKTILPYGHVLNTYLMRERASTNPKIDYASLIDELQEFGGKEVAIHLFMKKEANKWILIFSDVDMEFVIGYVLGKD